MSRAVVALALVAAVAPAGPSQADPDGDRLEAVDFDHEMEQRSVLWEEVLEPNRNAYKLNVGHALEYAGRRDEQSFDEAESLLKRAIEINPDNPDAYWILGRLQEKREKWSECAHTYARLFAIAPTYKPDKPLGRFSRSREWTFDFGLATCRAQLGQYEAAIAHYKRILGRGVDVKAVVYERLGEAYMALGRLTEAIDVLGIAHKLRPAQWRTTYALAVACDRDEQETRARDIMKAAVGQDHDLVRLSNPTPGLTPAADRLYYLGLAHKTRHNTEWAIAYFRQYLHTTGRGPWHKRASEHLDDLAAEPPLTPGQLSVQGSRQVDKDDLFAAVSAVTAELAACVDSVPGLLFEVRITALGRPSRAGKRARARRRVPVSRMAILGVRKPPPPGVRARIMHSFATEPDRATVAQQCVEAVAQKIRLPHPPGDPGQSYITVSFPVIKPVAKPTPTP